MRPFLMLCVLRILFLFNFITIIFIKSFNHFDVMGLTYFGIAWRAENSRIELEKIITRKDYNSELIQDALEIASRCESVCIDGKILYDDLEENKIYHNIFLRDLLGLPPEEFEKKLFYRKNMIEVTVHTLSGIAEDRGPDDDDIRKSIEFFNIVRDGCLTGKAKGSW